MSTSESAASPAASSTSAAVASSDINAPGLSKRIQHLVVTAGLPAAATATIGDVLGPRGGWIAVLIIGAATILLLIAILVYLANRKDELRLPRLLHPLTSDQELSWWWKGDRYWKCHVLYVLLVFGCLCIYSAFKTYAHVANGGYLAKHSTMLSDMQKQTGILEKSLAVQQESNETLKTIAKTNKELKKEVSDDPRKELANMGKSWDEETFLNSLNDQRTSLLYKQGGMRLQISKFWASEKLSEAGYQFLKNNIDVIDPNCADLAENISAVASISAEPLRDKRKNKVIAQVCNTNQKLVNELGAEMARWQKKSLDGSDYDRAMARTNADLYRLAIQELR